MTQFENAVTQSAGKANPASETIPSTVSTDNIDKSIISAQDVAQVVDIDAALQIQIMSVVQQAIDLAIFNTHEARVGNQYNLPASDLINIPTDTLFGEVSMSLEHAIVSAVFSTHERWVENQYNLPAGDLINLPTDTLFGEVSMSLEHAIVSAVFSTHERWVENQYNLPAGDLINPVPGGLPSEVYTILDRSVQAGIGVFTRGGRFGYTLDIGPLINIQASGIESRVSAAIASGVSAGLARAERQSLREQYSQESSSPFDRYNRPSYDGDGF